MISDRIRQQFIPALKRQLEVLAVSTADSSRPVESTRGRAGTITETIDGTTLTASIASTGRLACEVERICATDPRFQSMTPEQLEHCAHQLCDQLSYLEERLVVLEVDQAAPHVQVRSQRPRRQGNMRSYYEVQVGRSGIQLQRLTKADQQPRKAIPATLTHDVFLRVCADLAAAAAQP